MPMMVSPLLVVHAGGGLGQMPDPKVVAELELLVVASSGGQGPSSGGHGRRERRVGAGMRAKTQD